MQPARPGLGLSNLGARFLERLVLEVVALQQLPLLLRQLLDGGTNATAHLLQLDPLVGRQRIIRDSHAFGAVQAGAEHHGQTRDRAGDALHLILESASAPFTIREVAEVGIGAFRSRPASLQHPHLAKAVVDRPLDAVVGKGEEVRADPSIEALRGLEQAHLAPGDQLLHLELGVELLADLGGQRPHIGAVLLQDLRLGFRERQGPVTPLARPCSTDARASGPGGDRP